MKVLVASDGTALSCKVSKRFGHAKAFLWVDSRDWSFAVIDGVGEDAENHGFARMVELGVDRVATGNIGPYAFRDLTDHGIKVYVTRNMTVREAVENIVAGAFGPATQPTMKRAVHEGAGAGHHHDHQHDDHRHGDHEHGDGHGPGRGLGHGEGHGEGHGRGLGHGRGEGRGRGQGRGLGRGRGGHDD